VSLGRYEMKQHKPCSKLMDKRKQDKLQWLQNQRQINKNNLNVGRETSKTFRNK